MLSYPASIPLSNHTLTRLAELIHAHRAGLGGRWRRLNSGHQALLVLAHLRNGDTYARLASVFGIGTSTAWRYVREALGLLAALADNVHAAVTQTRRLAYVILDGTLIPIDRLADWPTSSRTTRANTTGTGSTSRCSPTRPDAWYGPPRRCPEPHTI